MAWFQFISEYFNVSIYRDASVIRINVFWTQSGYAQIEIGVDRIKFYVEIEKNSVFKKIKIQLKVSGTQDHFY